MEESGRKVLVVKDEALVERIENIRERLGLKHNSEVVRFLVKYYEDITGGVKP